MSAAAVGATATATATTTKSFAVPSLALATPTTTTTPPLPTYEDVLATAAAGAAQEGTVSVSVSTTTSAALVLLVWQICIRYVVYSILFSLAVAGLCNARSWFWVVWSDLNDRHRYRNGNVRNVTCFAILTAILLHYHRAVRLLQLQQTHDDDDSNNNKNSLHGHLPRLATTLLNRTAMSHQRQDESMSEGFHLDHFDTSSTEGQEQRQRQLQLLLLAAVSMMTGYLLFEAIFVRIYCFPLSWAKSVERLLAFITFATFSTLLLVRTMTTTITATSTAPPMDQSLPFYIHSIWHAYTFFQLITAYQAIQIHQKERQLQRQSKGQNTASNGSTFSSTLAQKKALGQTDYWIVHGQEYDLTDFVKRHPGGSEPILLGQGRDCTALFESYHPFTNQHRVVLSKYRVTPPAEKHQNSNSNDNKMENQDDPKQQQVLLPPKDFFYSVVCDRVAAALRQAGVDPVNDRAATTTRMLYYGLILTGVLCFGYGHVAQGKLWCAFPFGVFSWLLGALGHDAGHFTTSRRPIVNDIGLLLGASFMGNPIMWQHQHTYAHHSFTNDVHSDPDLHHFHTFLRVHGAFRRKNIHKNQSSKLFVAWSWTFVVFGTCVLYPRDMILQHSLHCLVEWTDRHRWSRVVFMYAHLILYVSLFMILPFWTYGAWYTALLACTLHIATSSMLFAFFSQVNHINEAALDEKALLERNKARPVELQNSWAIRQVETSNNYALDNRLWYYLALGLNYQIEHHLFPGLNHCHLHIVAPVVEATCREYGVVYKNYKTYSEAIQTVFDWLDQLAKTATTTIDDKSVEAANPTLEKVKVPQD